MKLFAQNNLNYTDNGMSHNDNQRENVCNWQNTDA